MINRIILLIFFGCAVGKDVQRDFVFRSLQINASAPSAAHIQDLPNWDPEDDNFINVPIQECGTKDVVNQAQFAELKYLNMTPPCEETSQGYCGVRKDQNITFIVKFLTKNYNDQFRVRVHLVEKHFGFETGVWPEFGICYPFFNITCPQEPGIVHSAVFSEIPREIPPIPVIVRIRLLSVNEKGDKNVAICRQAKMQVLH